jgi:hypothetical protein
MKTERILLVVVPIFLLFAFLRRLFFPEGEWPASRAGAVINLRVLSAKARRRLPS